MKNLREALAGGCTALAFIGGVAGIWAVGTPVAEAQQSPKANAKLRPAFTGTVYDIKGGDFDGRRGYLFTIDNRGKAKKDRQLPGTLDVATTAILAVGDGGFEGRSDLGEPLYAERAQETLLPGEAGFIAVVEPEVSEITYRLQGMIVEAVYAASNNEVLNLGDGPDLPNHLPPHPGSAGDVDLLGIDSNGNGVRDDVEVELAVFYEDTPEVLPYVYQLARSLNSILAIGASGSEEDARQYVSSKEFGLTSYCLVLYSHANSLPMYWTGRRRTETKIFMLDTPERRNAYDAFDDLLLGGVVFDTPETSDEECAELGAQQ